MEGFITLMFFLLSSNIVSSDQSYEACNPTDCGGLKLTYPFYVAGRQPSNCGLPGLQVSCKQSLALLNLSGDTYIIRNISYTDQTLWIVNSAFSHSTFECSNITSVHNLTLNNTSLEFTSKPIREIVLLQDCSIKAWKAMSNSTKVICNNNPYRNRSNSVVGAYDEDLNWKEVAGECRLAVSVPYEDSSASKLEDKMRAGVALKWRSSDKCQLCQKTGGRCVYNQTTATLEFQCSCSNDYGSNNVCVTSKAVHIAMWVIGVVVILVLGLVLIIVICCIRTCKQIIKSAIKRAKSRSQTGRDNRNLEHFIRNQESLAPKRYTYKEIKKMTKSLKEKLGEGGFSVVYKGKLLDGRLVAVKLLKQSKGDVQDFINEVASMSGTNHVNVVALLGFCFEDRKRCLVYEFMPNGSLEKYRRAGANNNQSLSWETLFEIALGIARGLEYLHRGCNTRILHFDIKPHNILLGENFCPKISDFGLAKLCPQSERSKVSMSEARGTIGYIAPEVFCRNFGDVSQKSDVYSYGMMVLEVIGCRDNANANVNADTCSSQYFPHWIYRKLNRDQEQDAEEIMNDEEKRLQRKMILVSLWCIQSMPFSRPSMDRVVQMLEGSLYSIEVPPIPTLTSPPRTPPSDPSGSSTITIDSYSERTSEP